MGHEWETLANDPEVKPLLTRTVNGREVSATYMRHAERVSEHREVEELDRKLSDPVERKGLQNPGKLRQQNERRKANLLAQSPPTDLKASQRDKLRRLEVVTRDFVGENMPTAEQMRHNPPGAVDHHMAWDRATKPALLTWKSVRILLAPDSDAVDLANFERYRPSAATRNLYADGQIGRPFALGPQAKAHYDDIDWASPDVAAHVQDLIDRGAVKVRVNGHTKPARRAQPAKPLAEHRCDAVGCETVYRGSLGVTNLRRHKAKVHGLREEVPA